MPDARETTPLGRRERRKLEVRGRILEAAAALFAERGPRDTTIADICERAEVAEKTFFNHFVARQHLIRAIAETSMLELLAKIEALRKQAGSPRERIERFFTQLVDDAEDAGPMQRELLTELIHAAHESGSEEQQARRLHDAFEGLVREGTAAHERGDSETLTEMVQGAFYVLMLSWANLDGYPLRERAAALARFLGDASERGGRPSAARRPA